MLYLFQKGTTVFVHFIYKLLLSLNYDDDLSLSSSGRILAPNPLSSIVQNNLLLLLIELYNL